jgi:hypothetical protein
VLTVRPLPLVILVIALLAASLSAQEEPSACYVAVSEIRMLDEAQWADARGLFRGVAAKDGFAYVVSQADLLYVFDLRAIPDGDGETLVRIDQPAAEIPLRRGNCNGVLRDEDRLYVYGWSGGEIFDVSDAAHPVEIGSFRDSDERIFHLVKHGDFLVAACHERVVVYSETMLPEHPVVAYSLVMEPRVQANRVCVVGDRLCVCGSRLRSSGATEHWLGIWDVTDFIRPILLQMTKASPCDTQLISHDGCLLRIAGGGAELWQADGTELTLLDCETSLGCAFAIDGDDVVFDGGSLKVADGRIERLCSFEAHPDPFYDGFPSVGVATDGLVLLPRSRSILILRCESGS